MELLTYAPGASIPLKREEFVKFRAALPSDEARKELDKLKLEGRLILVD